MRPLQQWLLDTPTEGHRASRWTVPVSVGRFWSRRPGGPVAAADTAFNLLVTGGYEMRHRGGRALVGPARAVFTRRGLDHGVRPVGPLREGLYVRLHPAGWRELHEAIGGPSDLRFHTVEPGVAVSLHRLEEVAAGLDEDSLLECALAVLEAAMSVTREPPAVPDHHDAVQAVEERLTAHPGAAHPLTELARGVGLSRFQLARAFRQHTGRTVSATREAIRMGVALDRVRRGQPLTDLALELGYTSHAHFTARFRRYFGRPPRDLRGPAPI